MSPTADPWAGERYRARNRVTGTLVVLVEAEAQGFDPESGGGKWALICDEHATLLQHENQTALRSYLPAPWEWCQDCLAIYEAKQQGGAQ